MDHDGFWKEALDRYLQPFLRLCFPGVHAGINWSRPHVPLDQELRQFNEAQLAQEHSPVAIVILAQRRRQSPGERKMLKWDLTRRLYERGYCQEEVVELFRLIDWLAAREAVRMVLETRFGRLPAPLLEHLSDLNDLARLKRLLRRASKVGSLEEFKTRADGNFTYFDYSEFYPERLTQVRAPSGLTAKFFYNANGQLWKIEDAQQLVSQFSYDSHGRIQALITPYGTTIFAWSPDVAQGTGNIVNRALIVTEPGGRKHLYAYRNNSAKLTDAPGAPDLLPSSYGPAEVPNTPANDTLNNSGLHICDSFYWGPHQFDALSHGLFIWSGD